MIAVYPMLVSPNINPNVLPGICKVLERFVMIYELEDVAQSFRLKGKITIGGVEGLASQASKFMLKHRAHENFMLEVKGDQGGPEQYERTRAYKKAADAAEATERSEQERERMFKAEREKRETEQGISKERELRDIETGKIETAMSKKTMHIDFPRVEGMHVEPTFCTVDTANGTKLLGIKVIPYPIKNSEELEKMISTDLSFNIVDKFMYSKTRELFKYWYQVYDFLSDKIPFMKSRDISGNIEKDILFASTKYKEKIFCLLSQQDLEDDKHFRKAGSVSKLFGLGWGSIIINDDVNKRTNFCMKEFGGMCSSVPHGLLFSSFGKENYKVYEKIEDIQKVTSPFFKHKISPRNLFKESVIEAKISTYLDYLNEDFKEDLGNKAKETADEAGRKIFNRKKAQEWTLNKADKIAEKIIDRTEKIVSGAKKINAAAPTKVKVGTAIGVGALATIVGTEVYRNYMTKAARVCAGLHSKEKSECMKKYKEQARVAKDKILAKMKNRK